MTNDKEKGNAEKGESNLNIIFLRHGDKMLGNIAIKYNLFLFHKLF